jgi:hypothetical protein
MAEAASKARAASSPNWTGSPVLWRAMAGSAIS